MGKKILIVQTAFLGDVILTLPMLQSIKKNFPDSSIDFLCIPGTAGVLKNNPYLSEVVMYDKRNSGIKGFAKLVRKLKSKKYDFLISPHRSYRTSVISYLSSAGQTISFQNSSLNFLYDVITNYDGSVHEIKRNLNLLKAIGIEENEIVRPELFPGEGDKEKAESFFKGKNISSQDKIIAIAPGSVWFTKRFPAEKFVKVCDLLNDDLHKIILIGGHADRFVSEFILKNSLNKNIIDATGNFSILESAELIRRSDLLITNDSAPLHIANAVGTKVIAIFGATIPQFGFYPFGKDDVIIETSGLNCRPCSIHGGNKCPINTFVCMKSISEEKIILEVSRMLR